MGTTTSDAAWTWVPSILYYRTVLGLGRHDRGNQGGGSYGHGQAAPGLAQPLPAHGPCSAPTHRTCACLDSFLARGRKTEHGRRTCLVAWPAARYVSVRAWCRNVSMLTEMSDRVAMMPGGPTVTPTTTALPCHLQYFPGEQQDRVV